LYLFDNYNEKNWPKVCTHNELSKEQFDNKEMKMIIRTEGLSKLFRTTEVETTALDEINLSIAEGEFTSIMGPSGCGKSTLLHILGLIDNPDGGKYWFMGEEVASYSERQRAMLRKQNIGFVFQSFDGTKSLVIPFEKSEGIDMEFPNEELIIPTLETWSEPEDAQAEFTALVAQAIGKIKSGAMDKVVVSRRVELASPELHPLVVLKRLKQLYNNAFCYFIYHPKAGSWAGASPEVLLRHQTGKVETVSLAGTRSHRSEESLDWTEKEYREQGLVTAYIEKQLLKHCERVEVGERINQQAGHLFHLKTVLKGTLSNPTQLMPLVKDLHPTPAVCGLPLESARDFLEHHEGYDRSFYTGYLGVYNSQPDQPTQLFVNLRCMQLRENKVQIYVGCGITAESDPIEEFHETVQKSAVMRRILQK
jgi:isochorismate synthase